MASAPAEKLSPRFIEAEKDLSN